MDSYAYAQVNIQCFWFMRQVLFTEPLKPELIVRSVKTFQSMTVQCLLLTDEFYV